MILKNYEPLQKVTDSKIAEACGSSLMDLKGLWSRSYISKKDYCVLHMD